MLFLHIISRRQSWLLWFALALLLSGFHCLRCSSRIFPRKSWFNQQFCCQFAASVSWLSRVTGSFEQIWTCYILASPILIYAGVFADYLHPWVLLPHHQRSRLFSLFCSQYYIHYYYTFHFLRHKSLHIRILMQRKLQSVLRQRYSSSARVNLTVSPDYFY